MYECLRRIATRGRRVCLSLLLCLLKCPHITTEVRDTAFATLMKLCLSSKNSYSHVVQVDCWNRFAHLDRVHFANWKLFRHSHKHIESRRNVLLFEARLGLQYPVDKPWPWRCKRHHDGLLSTRDASPTKNAETCQHSVVPHPVFSLTSRNLKTRPHLRRTNALCACQRPDSTFSSDCMAEMSLQPVHQWALRSKITFVRIVNVLQYDTISPAQRSRRCLSRA